MNKTLIGNIAGGVLVASLLVGGSIAGASFHNAQVQADAQAQHVLVVKAAAVAAQTAADAAAAQAVIDAATAQKVLDDAAAAKAAADALAAQQAQAAAQAAATQAAAQVAAQKVIAPVTKTATKTATQQSVAAPAVVAPPALIKCPVGSSANSGDAGNDTSCFPNICFHITLPDAAHPECVTPFKP